MQVPKAESSFDMCFVFPFQLRSADALVLEQNGPGKSKSCFSWLWARQKRLTELPPPIWSTQRPVSVFHIIFVRWRVVLTMGDPVCRAAAPLGHRK